MDSICYFSKKFWFLKKKSLCLKSKLTVFFLLFLHVSSWKRWQLSQTMVDCKVSHHIFRKCWTMPITVCIFELRNIFHLILTFFIFHLITSIAVYMQVLAGTEGITLVFIFKIKYFNTLAFVSEIIWVEFPYIFMIFVSGWLILSER